MNSFIFEYFSDDNQKSKHDFYFDNILCRRKLRKPHEPRHRKDYVYFEESSRDVAICCDYLHDSTLRGMSM